MEIRDWRRALSKKGTMADTAGRERKKKERNVRQPQSSQIPPTYYLSTPRQTFSFPFRLFFASLFVARPFSHRSCARAAPAQRAMGQTQRPCQARGLWCVANRVIVIFSRASRVSLNVQGVCAERQTRCHTPRGVSFSPKPAAPPVCVCVDSPCQSVAVCSDNFRSSSATTSSSSTSRHLQAAKKREKN